MSLSRYLPNVLERGDAAPMVTEGPHGDCRVTVININSYKKYSGTAPRNDNAKNVVGGVIAKVGASSAIEMHTVISRPAAIPSRTFGHHSNDKSTGRYWMNPSALVLALTLCFSLCIFVDTSWAAPTTEEAHDKAQDIAHSVLSPFCPGRLLSDCPSTSARELKEKIQQKILEGQSESAIYDFLYATYGDDIRSTPSTSGIGAIAWFAPLAFVLGGLILIVAWLSLRKSESELPTPSQGKISEELQKRIAKEISKE